MTPRARLVVDRFAGRLSEQAFVSRAPRNQRPAGRLRGSGFDPVAAPGLGAWPGESAAFRGNRELFARNAKTDMRAFGRVGHRGGMAILSGVMPLFDDAIIRPAEVGEE